MRPSPLACRPAGLGLALGLAAQAAGAAGTPQDTVRAFNAAISGRNLERASVLFAPGATQFTLRPAHAGMAASAPATLTTDLKAHWTQVGTLLFSVTKSYSRTPTILDTRVDGELATVWARIDTETLDRTATAPRSERFAEVYLLVRRDGTWQIAGVADNRAGRGAPPAAAPPPR